MTSFRALQHALHEAEQRVSEARQADIDNPYLDHTRFYSHAYWLAYQALCEAWWQWREATKGVYYPLVAHGQVYEPGLILFMPKDTVELEAVTVKVQKARAA